MTLNLTNRRLAPFILVALAGSVLALQGCDQTTAPTPSSPSTPPRGPTLSVAPHEPAGFVVVTDWPMDATFGNGWTRFDADVGNLFIVRDSTTPGSLPNVAQWHEHHSSDGSTGWTTLHHGIASPAATQTDIALWIQLRNGWQGAVGLTSIATARLVIAHSDAGQPVLAVNLANSPDNPGIPTISRDGFDRLVLANVDSSPLRPGQWYRVELYLKQSTDSASQDGVLQWWINDAAMGRYTNVNYKTGFSDVMVDPYLIRNPDTLSIDDFRISIPGAANPTPLTGLTVLATQDQSALIQFRTESDGTGQPANYQVRYASQDLPWDSATVGTLVGCGDASDPGTGGIVRSCTVPNLIPGTSYGFRVAAYRGSNPDSAVFGLPSSIQFGSTSPAGHPGTAYNLGAISESDSTVDLMFAVGDDGTGSAAKFEVRYAPTPLGWGWGSATVVTVGTCTSYHPAIESHATCDVRGLAPGTSYDFQLVEYRGTLNQDAVFGGLSNVATGVTTGSAPPPPPPGTVNDLAVDTVGATSVTLSFTAVGDGTGQPASYDIRFAPTPIGWGWGSATKVSQGTCSTPVAGTAIGVRHVCTVEGLTAGTSYDFQLVPFRGTLDVNAVFGGLSNTPTGVPHQ